MLIVGTKEGILLGTRDGTGLVNFAFVGGVDGVTEVFSHGELDGCEEGLRVILSVTYTGDTLSVPAGNEGASAG